MGYYYNFTGETKFNRPLTQEELDEFNHLYPYQNIEVCSNYLSVYNETKICDIRPILIQLSNEFFKPRNIYFNGRLDYNGEEFDDVGYYDIDSKNNTFNHYIGKIKIEYTLSNY